MRTYPRCKNCGGSGRHAHKAASIEDKGDNLRVSDSQVLTPEAPQPWSQPELQLPTVEVVQREFEVGMESEVQPTTRQRPTITTSGVPDYATLEDSGPKSEGGQ